MPIALAAPIADDPLPASAYFSLNTLAPQDEWGLTIRHPFLLASDIPALVQLWVRIDLLDFIAFSLIYCKGDESEGVYLVQSGRESQWISCLTLPCSIWEWRRKESIGFHQVNELSLILILPASSFFFNSKMIFYSHLDKLELIEPAAVSEKALTTLYSRLASTK